MLSRLTPGMVIGLVDDPTGTLLSAGNQNSDTIVNFRVNQSSGRLKPIGNPVNFGSPVTIVYRQLAANRS